MPNWTEAQLRKLGYNDLSILWKAYCIENKEESEYPIKNLKKRDLKCKLKQIEVMELATAKRLVYERQSAKKKDCITKFAEKQAKAEGNQRSVQMEKADKLKSQLKAGKAAYAYLFDDSVGSILNLVEQVRRISTEGFSWKKLSKQFIDANNIKYIDNMTEVQMAIFTDNCLRFAKMVDFRGIACLHDQNVYYALTVGAWFKVLISLSIVEVEEDSGCYAKPKQNKDNRAHFAIPNGRLDKDLGKEISLEIPASMLNGNAIDENNLRMFGTEFHAAHTCENRYCVKSEHIQRHEAERNGTENRRMNKTSR